MGTETKIQRGILGIILLLGIYGIVDHTWVTEDAYITFKHIDNLFAGNGFTFNRGEHVEGFTHPAWATLIIFLRLVGISNHSASVILGIICSITGMILGLRYLRKSELTLLIFPVLLVVNSGFRDFSTSGLEFSLTFLLLVIFFSYVLDREISGSYAIPTLLSLLYLTRPEFGLFLAYYSIYFFIRNFKKPEFRPKLLRFGTPILIIAVGYHIFRFIYYSDILPNTFYAKSGGESNYSQGFKYLYHTLRYSPLLVPLLLFSVFSGIYLRKEISNDSRNFFLRDFFAMLPMVFYIVRVGGDFMAFRLLLPSLTIFTILSHYYLNTYWLPKIKTTRTILIVNTALLLFCFYSVFYGKTPFNKGFLADERQVFYRDLNQDLISRFKEIRYPWYIEGLKVRKLAECLNYPNFVITNSISKAKCSTGLGLGYYSVGAGTNVSVIDELGLTDKFIAKQKRRPGTRPGHDREVDLDYLIERGTLFCSLNNKEYDEAMQTKFGVIINLDPEFLFRLGRDEYLKRSGKLKLIYLKTRFAADDDGKKLHEYLKLLEARYKIQIMQLKDVVLPEYEKYSQCWL